MKKKSSDEYTCKMLLFIPITIMLLLPGKIKGKQRKKLGESNGKLPQRTCPGCSVPEPYRSPDWALVPAQTGPRAEY
jgi:hypothetical protein